MVCGCVLHRGQRGEGWCVSLTLCRYDIRMGFLSVRSWARVRRVSLGRESSEGEILGASCRYCKPFCRVPCMMWCALLMLTV